MIVSRILKLLRTQDWWNYKIPLALSMAYAFAWKMGIPLSTLGFRLVLLLLAGIVCGVYASVFNDLTDIEEDRLAGKKTEMMSISSIHRHAIVLLSTLAVWGVVGILLWQHLILSAGCCCLIWVVYTLYSIEPIRLKARGVWGVICVAVGEHMLAGLLGAFLMTEHSGAGFTDLPAGFPWCWLVAWLLCSFTFGFRSIVWHQLCDYENDCLTRTPTLVALIGPQPAQRLVEQFLFPLELLSLATILLLSGNIWSSGLLLLYVGMDWFRWRYCGISLMIVATRPSYRIVLLEYYQLFLPLSFLLPTAIEYGPGIAFIVAQLALFPIPVRVLLNDVGGQLLPRVWRRARSVL